MVRGAWSALAMRRSNAFRTMVDAAVGEDAAATVPKSIIAPETRQMSTNCHVPPQISGGAMCRSKAFSTMVDAAVGEDAAATVPKSTFAKGSTPNVNIIGPKKREVID